MAVGDADLRRLKLTRVPLFRLLRASHTPAVIGQCVFMGDRASTGVVSAWYADLYLWCFLSGHHALEAAKSDLVCGDPR